MPIIRAIDSGFVPRAHIAAASSVQWTRKLYDVGTFEIHTAMHVKGAEQLLPGRIVFLDERHAGIIDYYDADEKKSGVPVTAKGKELKNLCFWRSTAPSQLEDTQFFGYDRFPALTDPDAPAESVIKHYADRHMVNPDDTVRGFPGLVIAEDQLRGPEMRWQSRFEPLTAVYKSIGELTGMGYEIRLDLENSQFVFDVIAGRDRTSASDSPVVFATAWGNVSGLKYSEDESGWANTGYAGGAGENEGRLIQVVYEDDIPRSGWDRRETWLDCGSVELVDDLLYEGKYKLRDKSRARGLSGDVIPAGPFRYGMHWDIGDYVTLKSRVSGVEMDTQITEVRLSYEKGKADIKPIFGKRPKNVLDEIRKIGVVR
jgi:hypothetical protein